jgi:hypothetical protein
MDSAADHQSGGHDQEHGLVEVSGMTVAQVLAEEDTVFANAVRRLLDEQDSTEVRFTGFGNRTPTGDE